MAKYLITGGSVAYRQDGQRIIHQKGDIVELPEELAAKINPRFIQLIPPEVVEIIEVPQVPAPTVEPALVAEAPKRVRRTVKHDV